MFASLNRIVNYETQKNKDLTECTLGIRDTSTAVCVSPAGGWCGVGTCLLSVCLPILPTNHAVIQTNDFISQSDSGPFERVNTVGGEKRQTRQKDGKGERESDRERVIERGGSALHSYEQSYNYYPDLN